MTASHFWHGYTSSTHATAATVASLDNVEREGLIDNVRALEKQLPQLLTPLAQYPDIAPVRTGQGLLAAVELTAETRTADPRPPKAVTAPMRRTGVRTRSLLDGELQFSPPLTVDTKEAGEFIAAALTGLDKTAHLTEAAR